MTTLIIFLILSLAEFILIYFKVEQMKEACEIGQTIGQTIGLKGKYQPLVDRFARFVIGIKWLLWIFVPIILCLNLLIAWIVSWTIGVIFFICSFF